MTHPAADEVRELVKKTRILMGRSLMPENLEHDGFIDTANLLRQIPQMLDMLERLSHPTADAGAVEQWQPIETAPKVKGEYFYCRLAWGPEWDKCTGEGFRWNGRWFVGAYFYNNAPFGECQNEIRQIEVNPTHWMPKPDAPAAIRSGGAS